MLLAMSLETFQVVNMILGTSEYPMKKKDIRLPFMEQTEQPGFIEKKDG